MSALKRYRVNVLVSMYVYKGCHDIGKTYCDIFLIALIKTSILRVLQKQYRSPTDPNKFKSATIISVIFLNKEQLELHVLCPLSGFLLLFDVSNLMCNSSCRRKKSVENYFFRHDNKSLRNDYRLCCVMENT